MPFAVFFADGGVAFHEGTLERRSAGCVRLNIQDAQRFYTYLQLGDKVQIAA
jgi:lipoprotein-anchoring transpeptidase ErfK/SrfK